jgi:hypothetical protein
LYAAFCSIEVNFNKDILSSKIYSSFQRFDGRPYKGGLEEKIKILIDRVASYLPPKDERVALSEQKDRVDAAYPILKNEYFHKTMKQIIFPDSSLPKKDYISTDEFYADVKKATAFGFWSGQIGSFPSKTVFGDIEDDDD